MNKKRNQKQKVDPKKINPYDTGITTRIKGKKSKPYSKL